MAQQQTCVARVGTKRRSLGPFQQLALSMHILYVLYSSVELMVVRPVLTYFWQPMVLERSIR